MAETPCHGTVMVRVDMPAATGICLPHMGKVPPNDPLIGMVLEDRYEIKRKLGEGGMGAVYEGIHLLIRKRVAIKCLHAELATNQDVVARFRREALAATAIGHQNIIEVNDLVQLEDGTIFMILEYLEGREWAEDLENGGAQPLGKVVHIISQVCEALSAAHAKGIIHRDLKPENIFLIERGRDPDFAKLLDFGISKVKDPVVSPQKLTKTGLAMGTPYYMAPEQALGRKDIDHRADIFSLGVILFEALTARLPFEGDSIPLLLHQICYERAPSLVEIRPDIPKDLEKIVTTMMAKNPGDRYPDCTAIIEDIKPYSDIDDAPVLSEISAQNANTLPTERSITPPDTGSFTGDNPSMAAQGADATPTIDHTGAERVSGHSWSFWVYVIFVLVVVGGVFGLLVAIFINWKDDAPELPGTTRESGLVHNTKSKDASPPGKNKMVTKMVNIQVSSEPPEAELYLDGDPIPNPFDGDLPATNEARSLEARLDGYRRWNREISLQYAQRIQIEMQKTTSQSKIKRRANKATGVSVKHEQFADKIPRERDELPSEQPASTEPSKSREQSELLEEIKRVELP